MRVHYESRGDVIREQAVMEKFAVAFPCIYEKLPESYRLDYICLDPYSRRPFGYVEVKCRNMTWGQYPDVMLSVGKATAARRLQAVTGMGSRFVIATKDKILWASFNDFIGNASLVRMGGRTLDTRDSADIEPVFHIPNAMFKEIVD